MLLPVLAGLGALVWMGNPRSRRRRKRHQKNPKISTMLGDLMGAPVQRIKPNVTYKIRVLKEGNTGYYRGHVTGYDDQGRFIGTLDMGRAENERIAYDEAYDYLKAMGGGSTNNPLRCGHSRAVVSANIRELIHSGRKQSQAVAIAMRKAGIRRNAPLTPSQARALKGILKAHGRRCNPKRKRNRT